MNIRMYDAIAEAVGSPHMDDVVMHADTMTNVLRQFSETTTVGQLLAMLNPPPAATENG